MYFNCEYFHDSIFKMLRDTSKNNKEHKDSASDSFIDYNQRIIHVIIDCSSISQIDYSGGKCFINTIRELNDHEYNVYLCNLRCKLYSIDNATFLTICTTQLSIKLWT